MTAFAGNKGRNEVDSKGRKEYDQPPYGVASHVRTSLKGYRCKEKKASEEKFEWKRVGSHKKPPFKPYIGKIDGQL